MQEKLIPRLTFNPGQEPGLALTAEQPGPGPRFSKVPKSFRTRKAVAKSQTLWLQSCFMHIFSIGTEVPFIQEVSGVYTSLSLNTD